jgi:hypothetical protein
MLRWAEKKSGVRITPTQGSFSTSVAASGNTHAGAGAVDISTRVLTRKERVRLMHALKDAGAACWYRTPDQGFSPHIHCLTIGGGKDGTEDIGGNRLSSAAQWQIRQYDKGMNGLSNAGKDNTYRASKRRFSFKQGKPVAR